MKVYVIGAIAGAVVMVLLTKGNFFAKAALGAIAGIVIVVTTL